MQTEMLKCSRDQENKTVNILKIVFKNEKIVMSPSCIVKRLKVLEHGKPPTTCFEAFKWTLKMDLRAHKRLFVLLLVSFYHSADSFKTGYTNRGDSTAKIFSLIDVFLIIWNKSHPIFKSALANFVKKSCFFLLFILFSVDYWQEMKEVGEVELCKFNLW